MESEQTGQSVFAPNAQHNATNLPRAIKEIDEYLSETFDAMAVIDECYGKVSSFFLSMADQKVGDADYDKLSKEDQQEALLYMTAALAIKGMASVSRGIKEAMAIEKVKRLHRQVAEKRAESLPRQISRVQRLHDEAAMTLIRHNGHPYKSSQLKNSFDDIADILEMELCQYRDLRFRLDLLYWLKDEYDAWLEGRLFSDTPIPVMGQSTIAAIYLVRDNAPKTDRFTPLLMTPQIVASAQPPVSATNLKTGMKSIADRLKESLDMTKYPAGKDFYSALEILAIVDAQVASVLEYFSLDEDPAAAGIQIEDKNEDGEGYFESDKLNYNALYAWLYINAGSENLPQIKDRLENNPVTARSMKALEDFYTMKGQYEKADNWIGINSLLFMAAGIVPVWTIGWKWYWLLLLSLLIIYMVFKIILQPNLREITDNLINKLTMMNSNYYYITSKEAGLIEPESNLKKMLESRNHIFGGLIIGGLIGMILGPLGAVIGAIIGAMIGSGSSNEIEDHGEGWEEIKIYSPFKQCMVSIILVAVLAFEIYAIFF